MDMLHPISKDHPRGCGEHGMRIAVYFLAEGSFPRMRGARLAFLPLLGAFGIIPADAGSTRFWSHTPPHTEDHPRGCGEHNWRACV